MLVHFNSFILFALYFIFCSLFYCRVYFVFVILILHLVQQPPTRKIGSIADYDPLNDNYGSLGSGYRSSGAHHVSDMFRGRFVKNIPHSH